MHISIIDDEKILANKILKKIQNSGYAASAFHGYQDFMRHGDASSELYIIDISLWDGTGFDIIRWLRKNQHSRVPIIIISGYGDTQNVIYWLELGADDYLTKPFIPDVLIARIKAILRRPRELVNNPVVRYKDVTFNTVTKETKIGSNSVYLTKNESLIVETFLSNQKKIVTRERLISNVWGWHHLSDVSDNTINVTLSNIRKKLSGNFMPKTVYNQGYILE
ncbi:MAG: DNA-binding response regulator VanRB [uncultured bacterium (gcode 4)]|uniref:DNA-binding response regulator VanRB n=1 Tax=uncultured bacterium (gcode 4) TaxID=1234023 RepID=K1XIY5_9BACT|nr:MAG: DNA-binding response regulator VanRB [uncultured bacterium (gcode 4)]